MALDLSQAGSPCLGLIGGIGVGATVHYYQALARVHAQRQRPLHLLMVHADMPKVLAHVQANQLEELSEYFVTLIARLKAGGADFAAISAVTPHLCIDILTSNSPLPLVNILQNVRESILGKRVAVFGTRFVIDTDLFGALRGKSTVHPTPSEVDQIHEAYTKTAARGEGSDEDHRKLTALARTLIQREGLEAIVFAGTDLALLFDQSNTTFPFIDCAQMHIDAIMKTMWDGRP
jgi:aspartate racemase